MRLNRRVPVGTHGGVRGRLSYLVRGASYSIVQFNIDGLMRGDYKSRMEGYAIARQNGWMSANDIRALENLNPIAQEEGGDAYLINGNMIPIGMAGLGYLLSAMNTTQNTEESSEETNPSEEKEEQPKRSPQRRKRKKEEQQDGETPDAGQSV